MNTYEVIFDYQYPNADNDIRKAIVTAESFNEAEEKVVTAMKGTFEGAKVLEIKLSDTYIF